MGKYLYCVIPCLEKKEFGPIGLGNNAARVFTVNYQDLAFVVSNCSDKSYYPTRKNALAHEFVIATLMKEYPVIPMSFGMVCTNEQQIFNVLKKNHQVFKSTLEFLRNRVEVGLKVWWEKDKFDKDIFEFDPRLLAMKEEIEVKPEDRGYFETIEFGKLVEQTANHLRKKYHDLIFRPLERIAVAGKVNSISSEFMVLNAAFLVEKEKEQEFDQIVNDIYLQYRERMNFKYTGPWPPYNFTNIHIKDI